MKPPQRKSKRQSIRETNQKDGFVLIARTPKHILRKLTKSFAPEFVKDNVRSIPLSGNKMEVWCRIECKTSTPHLGLVTLKEILSVIENQQTSSDPVVAKFAEDMEFLIKELTRDVTYNT